jgi:uncharacterized membrane protein YgaE (UPF0421/DUF939 family)
MAMRLTSAVRASKRDPLLQTVKTALATSLAWVVAGMLTPDGPPPVFAAIAAMLVVQPSLNQSLTKGVERSVGVIAGVILATLLGMAFSTGSLVVIVAVTAALGLSWALRLTPGSANQIAISALLVLAIGSSTPGYALFRVGETLVGAVIGIVVHLALVPPVVLTPAREALEELGEETARAMERLAAALTSGQTRSERHTLMTEARQLRALHETAAQALDETDESLALNPRSRKYQDAAESMRQSLVLLWKVGTQVRGMTRAYVDHYDDEVRDEPVVVGIAEELRRAAHDTRLHLQLVVVDPVSPPSDLTSPALTAPLDIGAPQHMRWILIGSLMEDLRRIRHELGARGM